MTTKTIEIRKRGGMTGEYIIVDEIDFERTSALKWNFHNKKTKYVKSEKLPIGHLIIGRPKKGYVVDHIDNNPLNNSRSNLRHITYSENAQNKKNKSGSSSIYFGVTKVNFSGKWCVQLCGKNHGTFENEIEAAKKYDIETIKKYGKNSKTNNLLTPIEIEKILYDGPENITKKSTISNIKGIKITKNGRFIPSIKIDSKSVYLGTYDTKEEAIQVRNKALDEKNKAYYDKIMKLEITRNKDNIACITINKKEKDVVKSFDILIDDSNWHTFLLTKIHISDGYAQLARESKKKSLHSVIYNEYCGGKLNENNVIDHINGNPLDNRISNLREVTKSVNSHNKAKKKGATSKYYGVVKTKAGTFSAKYSLNGKTKYIKTFKIELEAAQAYDNAIKEHHGNFAKLNFPDKC